MSTRCIDYIYNNKSYFSTYKSIYQPITIQKIERVLLTIGIGNIPLIVE